MMAVSLNKSVYNEENSIENIIELKKTPLLFHLFLIHFPFLYELNWVLSRGKMKCNELLSQIIIELVPEEIKLFACSESSVNWNV